MSRQDHATHEKQIAVRADQCVWEEGERGITVGSGVS